MKNSIFVLLLFISFTAYSQDQYVYRGTVPTTADFLKINVDPITSAMGNLIVSSGPTPFCSFKSPGSVAISSNSDELTNFAFSYIPLATPLSKDIKMMTFTANQWVTDGTYIGLNIQYFTMGDVHFFDEQANEIGFTIPQEYSFGLFYAKSFSETLNMGATIKGIYSSLSGKTDFNGNKTKPAFGIALDYSVNGIAPINNNFISYGLSLNNIGTKMSISNGTKSYIPMALQLGVGYKFMLGDRDYFFTGLEFGKMLVPSAPVYNQNGNIISGSNPDISVPQAIFSSFVDSPDGANGELKEVAVSLGAELCFKNQFFIRAGYNNESQGNGLGSYASFGLGLNKDFGNKRIKINISYGSATGENYSIKNSIKLGVALAIWE